MHDRKRKTKSPCPECFLHPRRCICLKIPLLDLRTRLTLVIHAKELRRTTNSGRLAVKALTNSEMIVRGVGAVDLSSFLRPGFHPLLLYPGVGAQELTPEFAKRLTRPVQLIVPDGNWRQASKVASRHPEIAHIDRVMIRELNSAQVHLRAESSDYGMSTLQAIAKSLMALGELRAGEELERLYQEKLRATLAGRGQLVASPSSGMWDPNCQNIKIS